MLPDLAAPSALTPLPDPGRLKHWRHFDAADWAHVRAGAVAFLLGSAGPVALFYLAFRVWSFPAAVLVVLATAVLAFLWQYGHNGVLDVFSATTFVLACVKALAGLVSQNALLYLAWPSVENLLYSLAFLASALAGHPLLALYARRLYPVPLLLEQSSGFKSTFVRLSLGWGVALTLRAALRLWLLHTLSLEGFLVVDTLVSWPFNSALVGGSIWYALRSLTRPRAVATGQPASD